MVAGEYLKFFVFTGMSLDQALRSELSACMCVCVCGDHPVRSQHVPCPLHSHRDLQK